MRMGFCVPVGRSISVDPRILDIDTDGSCLPHPRRGGMGIRFICVDPQGELINSRIQIRLENVLLRKQLERENSPSNLISVYETAP